MTILSPQTVDNSTDNLVTTSGNAGTARVLGVASKQQPIMFKKVFEVPGCNFEACREAEEWCEARGIAVGRMERGQPRGLLCGPYAISKWHNLRPYERATLDGRMIGDMRAGPVTVELKGDEGDYPIVPERYRE